MKSKKNLLAILAAFSCLPVSNAAEDTTNSYKSSLTKEKIDSISSDNLKSGKKDAHVVGKKLTPIKPSQSIQNSIKSNTSENIQEKKSTNQSLSVGKAVTLTILGVGAGVGGTLLTKHLMNRHKTPDTIPATVKSYLWNCAVLSYNWDDVERNEDPNTRRNTWYLRYFYGGEDAPKDKKNVTTLFNALLELYSKISASDVFKKLNLDDPECDILDSISTNVVFIPKTVKQNEKYVWKKPELEPGKVHAKMKKNSEIKSEGSIYGDGNNPGSVNYTATFACDNEGNITLKDFNIKKET